ncbi:MAG TPA: gfo/Idh/MocA family oxidoreductase, partial [Planctomycetaceae bacterium]|nr:gfo/Idh/MocA family oxidoreductase [Planctomycetaceae bacterium]
LGHLTTSLCHLGNVATRLGRSFQFDPKTEQAVGDPEANALMSRPYRDHWGKPKEA